jgi:hypothetical protein
VAADSYPVVEDGGSDPAGEERRLSSGLRRGGEGLGLWGSRDPADENGDEIRPGCGGWIGGRPICLMARMLEGEKSRSSIVTSPSSHVDRSRVIFQRRRRPSSSGRERVLFFFLSTWGDKVA